MSDRLTSIHLPGVSGDAGYADYGRKTVAEMLILIRKHAQRAKANAEAVLAAADEDFTVATYIGVHRQRDYTVLQRGRDA